MSNRYMTTSEAMKYVGAGRDYLRSRLDSVTDNRGNTIRTGREMTYHSEDVKKLKRQLDKERRKKREQTLHPEHLSPQDRKELAKKAYILRTLASAEDGLDQVARTYRDGIVHDFMSGKIKYEGDGRVVKSISLYQRKETEVSDKRVLDILSLGELVDFGIPVKPDARALRLKGTPHVKEKLRGICENFRKYCRLNDLDFYHMGNRVLKKRVNEFLERRGTRQKMKIKGKDLFPVIQDFRYGRLGEKKLGMYARKFVENCIKETFRPSTLRVTLTEEFEKSSAGISNGIVRKLDLTELNEIAEDLPVD